MFVRRSAQLAEAIEARQAEFADRCGVSKDTVASLETGRVSRPHRNPRYDNRAAPAGLSPVRRAGRVERSLTLGAHPSGPCRRRPACAPRGRTVRSNLPMTTSRGFQPGGGRRQCTESRHPIDERPSRSFSVSSSAAGAVRPSTRG